MTHFRHMSSEAVNTDNTYIEIRIYIVKAYIIVTLTYVRARARIEMRAKRHANALVIAHLCIEPSSEFYVCMIYVHIYATQHST